MTNLLRTKTVEQSIRDTKEGPDRLRKRLGPIDLTVFGIGVIIGTGIFVLTGKAAGLLAGPAVALSFVAAAVACGLAALCYAEFASTVPVAGSAYTFSYARSSTSPSRAGWWALTTTSPPREWCWSSPR